jgi:hypothetical protein
MKKGVATSQVATSIHIQNKDHHYNYIKNLIWFWCDHLMMVREHRQLPKKVTAFTINTESGQCKVRVRLDVYLKILEVRVPYMYLR